MSNSDNPTATPPEITEVAKIDAERQVYSIRFHPDGTELVAGCYDGLIRRWSMSAEEPRPLESLAGHNGWVQQIAFSPQRNCLFSTDSWGALRAWSYDHEKPEVKWSVDSAHDGWTKDLTVSNNEELIVTCGLDGMVKIWSSEDGSLIGELPKHPHPVYRIALAPNQYVIASADLMGTIRLWDRRSNKLIRETTLGKMHLYDRIQDVPGIYVLRFEDNGRRILCAGGQPTRTGNHQGIPTLHSLETDTLKIKQSRTFGVEKDGFIFELVRCQNGLMAMVTSGNPGAGQFLLVDPDEEKPLHSSTKISNCHSITLHPDGKRLVVAATNRNSQGNGAVRDKEGNYVANTSPLHVFELSDSRA